MEHCQGCLGWHREQAIFSPFTPSADSPSSLAGAATAAASTLRGGPWDGAATPRWPACVRDWAPDGGVIFRLRPTLPTPGSLSCPMP